MTQTKQQIMVALAADIQKKWGPQAVRRGDEVAEAASFLPLSTSITKLDALLEGGIMPGQITELCGMKTAGITTLALKTIAATQALGQKVIYIDFAFAFHPKYALSNKVNMQDLLIVRPSTPLEGIEIAADLLQRYSAGLIVFGHTQHGDRADSRAALRRLLNAVRRSSCAFIALNRSGNPLASPFHTSVSTRIQMRRIRWMHQWGIIHGYLTRTTVTQLNGHDYNKSVTLRFDPPKPGTRLP